MLNHILARFKEPSSWAAIAAVVAIFSPTLAPFVVKIGGGAAVLLGFFLPEGMAS